MTLYEINQECYKKLPPMTEEDRLKAEEDIIVWLDKCHPAANNCFNLKYLMLLNAEGRDYTVFAISEYGLDGHYGFLEELSDVIDSRGELKDIDFDDDGVNFWVQKDDICSLYKLFDYDFGVIEVP